MKSNSKIVDNNNILSDSGAATLKYNMNVLIIVPDNKTWLYTMFKYQMLEHQCSVVDTYTVWDRKALGSIPDISEGVLVTRIIWWELILAPCKAAK